MAFINESELPIDELDAEFYDEEFDAAEIDTLECGAENQDRAHDTKSPDKKDTLISGSNDLVHGLSNPDAVSFFEVFCLRDGVIKMFFSLMENTISY